MKKNKALVITLSTIAIILVIASIVGPTVWYFTTQQNTDSQIDLTQQKSQYLAKVEYMNNINDQEALILKNEIRTNINNQLNKLNLTESIDYQINNLDTIKNGDNLNNYLDDIIIASIASSIKAKGHFTLTLNVQENINKRTIPAIEIDANQSEGLSADAVLGIKGHIEFSVQSILNQGQLNRIDIDYQIINLSLIKEGAKFPEYSNQLKVHGISNRLTGEFAILFVLV